MLTEAYNNRSIARRIAGVEGAARDESKPDPLTMHDMIYNNDRKKFRSQTSDNMHT